MSQNTNGFNVNYAAWRISNMIRTTMRDDGDD